jgi:antirestriction protein ArdC
MLDLYQRVTDQVIAAIEAGAGAFEMPWHSTSGALRRPRNVVSGAAYQGINVLALWSQALVKGYHSSLWGTYRQWQEMGWQVRKGEKATVVVYYRQFPVLQDAADSSDDAPEYRLIARGRLVPLPHHVRECFLLGAPLGGEEGRDCVSPQNSHAQQHR